MKSKISEKIPIPEGVSCRYHQNKFLCNKGPVSLERIFSIPGVSFEISDSHVILSSEKGNKNELKCIKSAMSHIKNMFLGLERKYVYKLEACNVHFPMTLKTDGDTLVIGNFLGEKVPRVAIIKPGVDIEVKGTKITLFSNDIEAAGETATNIEKATKVKKRDRRVFQDGIFIVEKPGDVK